MVTTIPYLRKSMHQGLVNPENRKDHAYRFFPLEKGGQEGFDNVMAAKTL